MNNAPVLQVRGLCVSFGRGKKKFRAVRNVSFDIQRGETFGLVGESGSGKTTIGRSVIRMVPTDGGEILYNGEKINGMLIKMGYILCESPQEADLVIYNTCAVRENAEDRIFGNVGALKHAKRRNKRMVVCLCGCMVQQGHITEKIKKSFPYVDLVFGTHAAKNFPKML